MNFSNILEIFNCEKVSSEALGKLQEWKLVPREGEYLCPNGHKLKLVKSARGPDGWVWRCSKTYSTKKGKNKCDTIVSLRKGTFFNGSHLSICQIMAFSYFWVQNYDLAHISREVKISRQTAVDWNSFAREVVIYGMSEEDLQIGGVGKVVEIDESKVGRRKYHRGHAVEGQWVFGGVERGSNRCFLVPVEERSRDVLLPIIKKYILPGTTIVSDFWKAYDTLGSEGYIHFKVNHSMNFKDPLTGQHSNTIEGLWRHLKKYLPHYNRRKYFFNGYIQKFQFARRCRGLAKDPFKEFLSLAGKVYSPLAPCERVDLGWHPEDQDENLPSDPEDWPEDDGE